MSRMTIGEAARKWILAEAKSMNWDPYELTINATDHGVMHAVAELCERRGEDHAWNCVTRMVAGIRRSPLFEQRGYISLPERGFGKICSYGLKKSNNPTRKL